MIWNAYHFVDASRSVPADGEKLVYEGDVNMDGAGLYASRKVWQALDWASGPTLCRVHCGGWLFDGRKKLVCTERTIVARIDATDLLRAYARQCALDVIHLWDAPDVVREYLMTGDEGIRAAATYAAVRAARGGVGVAADFAAYAAARAADAATDAATAAATRAATRAAYAATRAAAAATRDARAAIQRKQRARLTRMVNAAFKARS